MHAIIDTTDGIASKVEAAFIGTDLKPETRRKILGKIKDSFFKYPLKINSRDNIIAMNIRVDDTIKKNQKWIDFKADLYFRSETKVSFVTRKGSVKL